MALKDEFSRCNKYSWIKCRLKTHRPEVTSFTSFNFKKIYIRRTETHKHSITFSSCSITFSSCSQNLTRYLWDFFVHCKLCYHYSEMKFFLSSASTGSIAFLDCYCLEIILSKLSFSCSTSTVLQQSLLLLLREGKKKKENLWEIPKCVTTTIQPDGCICLVCCFSHSSIYFSCHMKVVHVVCQREKLSSVSVIPFFLYLECHHFHFIL